MKVVDMVLEAFGVKRTAKDEGPAQEGGPEGERAEGSRAGSPGEGAPETPDAEAARAMAAGAAEAAIKAAAAAVHRKPVAPSETASMYRPARSFVDHLPWAEAIEGNAILLEDGRSVGAVWEIVPRGTEGRGTAWLGQIRDSLQDVLQDSFEERDTEQWVMQTYTSRELDLSAQAAALRHYIQDGAKGSRFSEFYADMLADHYRGIARPGGLFDDELSGTRWSGTSQRTMVVLYRWVRGGEETGELSPLEALEDAGEKLMGALDGLGVRSRRLTGGQIHAWLTRWFNGFTDAFPDNPSGFAREYLADEEIPYGDAFADSLFYSHPRSDAEHGVWWFDRTCTRLLAVEGMRKPPAIGVVTGETRHGDVLNAVLDQLPEGTTYVTTMVPVPQDTVDSHIDRISAASTGEAVEAIRAREDCEIAKGIMGERNKLYRLGIAFYLRGSSLADLNRRTNDARTVLLRYGFRVIAPRDDVRALDNYLLHLPMAYDPDADRKAGWRHGQFAWVQHISNVWPVFGRTTGTGHPGISFFNRGGEPLTFDPLNKLDRAKNAHALLVGPTGAGKSATLGAMLGQLMAVHRPRLFIVEAGNSFGLLADWFESLGLTVNRVALRPGSGVSLAPFADLAKLDLDDELVADTVTPEDEELAALDDVEDVEEGDDDDRTQRDILGELEVPLVVMVTGGEEREIERLRRQDRRTLRDAMKEAAKNARVRAKQVLTEDIVRALRTLAVTREELTAMERQRYREMADGIALFCDGFAGEVFNRPGEIWPEVDVTIVDLGYFARDGQEAATAVTTMTLVNVINNIAERDQHTGRQIVVAIDEAHILTTHQLVAPHLVKIVKMWRKLGAWLWLATQNLEDFPGTARKLLNMIEWWVCLVMPKEEVQAMERFRDLTDARRELLLSATKESGKYTEGVVLSGGKIETNVRVVPPSKMLALVQTESHEKVERAKLMEEHGISEVEAAYRIADRIDESRGIAA